MLKRAYTLGLFTCGLTVLLLSTTPASGSNLTSLLAPESKCPHQLEVRASTSVQEKAMLCMINYARRTQHLPALKANAQLNKVAISKDRSIIKCHDFSHYACGRDLTSWFRHAGYLSCGCSWRIGENIAWSGSSSPDSASLAPRFIMNAWLHSPEHLDNILNTTWKEQNVAVIKSPFDGYQHAVIWTNDFGVHSF